MNSAIKKSLGFIGKSNFADAMYLLKKVLRKSPKDIQALNVLGQVQIKLGEFQNAVSSLEKSIAINAYDFNIFAKLGYAYEKIAEFDKAISSYKQSLALNPEQPHVYDCLGRALAKDQQNYEAILYFMKALEAKPQDRDLHLNIGFASKDTGLYEIAIKHYAAARELDPTDERSLSCLLFNSHKDPARGLADFQKLALEYSQQMLPLIETNYAEAVTKRLDSSKTKLRVGFVSADLRRHPVSYYLFKVLKGIDRNKFDLFFYHNNSIEDDLTLEYKEMANEFRKVEKLNDAEFAQSIFEDEIDILFDMSGFTAGHRLGVFRYSSAPVQVTHVGYFGTLGMEEMDFILTDGHFVKEGEEQYYTEQVYKMDHCCLHCDSFDLPTQVTLEPSFVKNGYITFGSMNGSHKISPAVLAFWSKILHSCPDAKLLMDNHFVGSESNQKFIERRFNDNGINKDRLIFRDSKTRAEFLCGYNDVDIALDPFPYGGGTSTIESLMMGVPVITLAGDRWVGRMSENFLINIGHEELVATDLDDYHDKAIELANNKTRIAEYKSVLREDLEASEMKVEKHILRFQKALQDMWLIKSTQK